MQHAMLPCACMHPCVSSGTACRCKKLTRILGTGIKNIEAESQAVRMHAAAIMSCFAVAYIC